MCAAVQVSNSLAQRLPAVSPCQGLPRRPANSQRATLLLSSLDTHARPNLAARSPPAWPPARRVRSTQRKTDVSFLDRDCHPWVPYAASPARTRSRSSSSGRALGSVPFAAGLSLLSFRLVRTECARCTGEVGRMPTRTCPQTNKTFQTAPPGAAVLHTPFRACCFAACAQGHQRSQDYICSHVSAMRRRPTAPSTLWGWDE